MPGEEVGELQQNVFNTFWPGCDYNSRAAVVAMNESSPFSARIHLFPIWNRVLGIPS